MWTQQEINNKIDTLVNEITSQALKIDATQTQVLVILLATLQVQNSQLLEMIATLTKEIQNEHTKN